MRPSCCSWLFFLIILSFSSFSNASPPSCLAWHTIPTSCDDPANCDFYDSDLSTTSCKLSLPLSSTKECGSNNSEFNGEFTKHNQDGLTIYHYFFEKTFLHNGYYQYDQQFDYSAGGLSDNYKNPLVSALNIALNNDNCDVAQSILDSLANPVIDEGILHFENDSARCTITSSGETLCRVQGSAQQCDSNGENCRIIIGNDKDMSLDDYAKSKSKDKDNGGDVNGGKDDINKLKGDSGTSSDSSSSSNSSSNNSSNSGSNDNGNNGNGSGSGNSGSGNSDSGKGEGKGDDDGDGDCKGSDCPLKIDSEKDISAPISNFLDKLNGYLPHADPINGQCEPLRISTSFGSFDTSLHCESYEKIKPILSSFFIFLWGFLAIRIVLSA